MACKYFVIKLLSRAPGSSAYDANLDMFPLEFHGYKMPIPTTEYDFEPPDIQEPVDDSLMAFNMIKTHDEIQRLTGEQEALPPPIKLEATNVGHSAASDEP